MPNIKSAIKRVQVAERNKLRNTVVKTKVKNTIRKLMDELKNSKDKEKATELLSNCYKVIDKAVTKGVIHKNKAARKKSRLTKYVVKTLEQTAE